jgi:hypothetical protein
VPLTSFPARLFQIAQSTDAYGADLYLNDRVGDIFADNEVLRVIKGSSIRDSLPPDYVNGRAGSVQPSYPLQRKRSPATSNLGDNSRAGKRQKVYRPDDPVPSRERDPSDSEGENVLPEDIPIDEVIPDSQINEVEDGGRHIKQEKPSQASRPSYNQPSPVPGDGDDDEVVISDSQGKETSGRNTTRQTRQSLQNATSVREDLQIAAKTTPKPSNGAAHRPSNKRRERSDDISDFEEHTSITPTITPFRGISDTYSDFETDIEQPSSFLRRRGRVTPLRKSKKASPISAKPKVIQYGKKPATRSKAESSLNNSTPKATAISTPAITPRTAGMANGGPILPGMTRQDDSASADIGDDKSDEGVDVGAEEAAQEVSKIASESAKKKRIAELEQENATSIAKAKSKAAAALKRQEKAKRNLEAKEKKEKAAKEAEAAAAKAKLERESVLAEEARRQAEATKKAEAEKLEEAKRQEAEETRKREAEEARKQEAEDAKRREVEAAAQAENVKREEAAKREEASDKKDAEVASARKRSTSAISPGGMLGRAVASFNSQTAVTSPGASVVDMPPPPAAARGRQSTSPALTRKRSEDIKSTPILPPRGSSDIRPASSVEPSSATRRVSFAEPSPSVVGKTPSRATQSPAPIQTPKSVNGIKNLSGSFRQSTLVPPGTGAKSVTPKVSTPSSSQAPTSGQQVKATPTPRTRADITAALLNTINKGSCKLQSVSIIAILLKLTIYSISSEGGSSVKTKGHRHLL